MYDGPWELLSLSKFFSYIWTTVPKLMEDETLNSYIELTVVKPSLGTASWYLWIIRLKLTDGRYYAPHQSINIYVCWSYDCARFLVEFLYVSLLISLWYTLIPHPVMWFFSDAHLIPPPVLSVLQPILYIFMSLQPQQVSTIMCVCGIHMSILNQME